MRKKTVWAVVMVVMLGALVLGGTVGAWKQPPAMQESLPAAAYTSATPQAIVRTGLAPTYGAADSGGNQFVNTGREFLQVKNTNAAARYITITTPATVDGLAVADVYVTIPATTGDKMVGPFPTKWFNYTGALTKVDYSAVTNVTFAVVRLP